MLRTWSQWMESAINPQKQKAYFMSLSPMHLWWVQVETKWIFGLDFISPTLALYCRSSEWRNGSNGNCFNETYPIQRPFWGSGSNLSILRAVGKTLREMKVNVTFLNITQLSEFRKDGHTSVYTERRGKLVTSEQRLKPLSFADCIHWCLPGVPDTWNEILFAYLIDNWWIIKEDKPV